MNDDERFQEIKEKEIQRLIDSLGKEEPVKGILTDDEILKYAGDSYSAAKIRLKRGIGTQSDKIKVNDDFILLEFLAWVSCIPIIIGGVGFALNILVAKIIFVLILIITIGYPIYFMYFKDYTAPEYKQISTNEEESALEMEVTKISSNDDLLLLFESKEKIAREMIENRFPAPQITNTKFNGVLDNCKVVVESQIKSLNALTPTEKTKYEIESRKQLIKQIISKVDDLTNELILSEPSNIENVIEEMDDLIKSVKDYK